LGGPVCKRSGKGKGQKERGKTGGEGKEGREREGKEKEGDGALNDFSAGGERNLKLCHWWMWETPVHLVSVCLSIYVCLSLYLYVCLCLCQHDATDSLSVCTVDVGDPMPRNVVTALASSSSSTQSLDELTDRLAVLLCNVKPTAVRGVQSQALLLTAYDR